MSKRSWKPDGDGIRSRSIGYSRPKHSVAKTKAPKASVAPMSADELASLLATEEDTNVAERIEAELIKLVGRDRAIELVTKALEIGR